MPQQFKTSAQGQTSRFDLKNVAVNLVQQFPRSERAFLSVAELEAMRVRRSTVPASKHGLEAICGASCETGAM